MIWKKIVFILVQSSVFAPFFLCPAAPSVRAHPFVSGRVVGCGEKLGRVMTECGGVIINETGGIIMRRGEV